jgi:glucose-1-phosphate adenylyltransferase
LNHDFDYALILSGDQLYQMDFNEMIEEHIKHEADITIATLPVNAKGCPRVWDFKTNAESCIESLLKSQLRNFYQDGSQM